MGTKLLNITEVARRLDRPVTTLYDWRYKGIGPRSAKIGGKIAYRESDVEAWIDEQFLAVAGGARGR